LSSLCWQILTIYLAYWNTQVGEIQVIEHKINYPLCTSQFTILKQKSDADTDPLCYKNVIHHNFTECKIIYLTSSVDTSPNILISYSKLNLLGVSSMSKTLHLLWQDSSPLQKCCNVWSAPQKYKLNRVKDDISLFSSQVVHCLAQYSIHSDWWMAALLNRKVK
jgi:hypothetical protein